MDPLISVIVPVYNSEKKITRCISSIRKQNYDNLEIIIVDDGSNDKTPGICDDIASVDSRVKVIHQNNQGPSAARNKGLDTAVGEYISFVDSDDYVLPDMISRMYHNLIENDCDLSIVSYYREDENGKRYCNSKKNVKIKINTEEAFKYINLPGYFYIVVWDKLAKAKLYDGLRFPVNSKNGEDAPVTYELLQRATSIVYDSTPEYCYCATEKGLSSGITGDLSLTTERMLSIVREKYPNAEKYAVYGHLSECIGMYNKIVLQNKRTEWKAYEKKIRKELHKLLPKIKKEDFLDRKQFLQWKLLELCPSIYGLLYREYKKSHPEIMRH
ncbi:Glycosyl transferase family 2 [Bifidobacterium goeldii]|uniref:Glycosyl transferase family 2 n=2 Tax=Bifidobacterium goeldii TaxID=2306975 RepID=A0A430FFX1_9BIFI|nr:Glycosyl transferase family 2 [Bifidobacterium goeldii]